MLFHEWVWWWLNVLLVVEKFKWAEFAWLVGLAWRAYMHDQASTTWRVCTKYQKIKEAPPISIYVKSQVLTVTDMIGASWSCKGILSPGGMQSLAKILEKSLEKVLPTLTFFSEGGWGVGEATGQKSSLGHAPPYPLWECIVLLELSINIKVVFTFVAP